MLEFWSNRLFHILLLSTFVVVGQACSEEEEDDKPKKSKSVAAPTSSVSSGTTAAPVPQPVQPLEDIPPTLTWDETHSNLEVVVGVTATYTFTALSDQASPVSYEISTVESTCISITWFDEISINTVSGELRAKQQQMPRAPVSFLSMLKVSHRHSHRKSTSQCSLSSDLDQHLHRLHLMKIVRCLGLRF